MMSPIPAGSLVAPVFRATPPNEPWRYGSSSASLRGVREIEITRRHLLIAIMALVAVIAVLAPHFSAGQGNAQPPGDGSSANDLTAPRPITRAEGEQIVRLLWLRREHAIAQLATRSFAGFEVGGALRSDQAYSKYVRCGCATVKHAHRIVSVALVIPRSATPAPFLAIVEVEEPTIVSDPAYYRLVVTPSEADWRLALVAVDLPNTGDQRRLAAARDGYQLARAHTPRPGALMRSLAKVQQPLTNTTFPGAAHAGRNRWHTFGDVYTFALNGHQTIECGTIRARSTVRAGHGYRLIQHHNRQQYGPDVAPGGYRSVTSYDEYAACIVARPHRRGKVVSAYGFDPIPVKTVTRPRVKPTGAAAI